MGLRNLYFGRLIIIKPFWNPVINDFDFRAVDPRRVLFGKYARKEQDSEFSIEEIEDNLCALVERFPEKKKELMSKYGFTNEDTAEAEMYIKNPDVIYKEAWIGDYVIFKLDNIILDCIKNPYWDWDGILMSEEESQQLEKAEGEGRRELLQKAKLEQDTRKQESLTTIEGEITKTQYREMSQKVIEKNKLNNAKIYSIWGWHLRHFFTNDIVKMETKEQTLEEVIQYMKSSPENKKDFWFIGAHFQKFELSSESEAYLNSNFNLIENIRI
jgi:hypothetical protein